MQIAKIITATIASVALGTSLFAANNGSIFDHHNLTLTMSDGAPIPVTPLFTDSELAKVLPPPKPQTQVKIISGPEKIITCNPALPSSGLIPTNIQVQKELLPLDIKVSGYLAISSGTYLLKK